MSSKYSTPSKVPEKGPTGLVFDQLMAQHFDPWDKQVSENPDRLLKSYDRCQELGLIEKCLQIQSRKATDEELYLCHDQKYIEVLDDVVSNKSLKEMKDFCYRNFPSIYMNDKSMECARMAAGCAIELTEAILNGKIQNGLALIRPPGHHAMRNQGCGWCICNNVAIAGKNKCFFSDDVG